MTRRYAVLALAVIALAASLAALGRPRPAAVPRPSAPVALRVVPVSLRVEGDSCVPARIAVPVGARVELVVRSGQPRPVRVALAGYGDAVAIPALAPGAAWHGTFMADRPGEDFAWLIDGRPAGRFAVTGSHLVRGHR